MSDSSSRLSQSVISTISTAIAEAGGNEVFFTGLLDRQGMVNSVTIVARGHNSAVPVITSSLDRAEVLIHNHPSGNLEPSNADLGIASRVADNGLGFYIVSNDAHEVYVVVEPLLRREKNLIDEESLLSFLDEQSEFAKTAPHYEVRPPQLSMMSSVARSFNKGKIGVFEAGTGVGKSFAYLLPAITWSLDNQERVLLTTQTINLQQQLADKDIPQASRILGRPIKAVLMKGRQNYVCLRRLMEAMQERDLFDEELEELERIHEWALTTQDGSKSDLSFMPRDLLWSRICSESDACMGMHCSRHEECFVMRVRKEAASASLLIVNHHLLFADLEARMGGAGYDDTAVLPPFHHIIFDEAHAMEAAATSFFSESFTRFKLNKQLSVLYRVKRSSIGGHLIALERLSSSAGEVQSGLAVMQELKDAFFDLEEKALAMIGERSTWRLCAKTATEAASVLQAMNLLRAAVSSFAGIVRTVLEGIAEDDMDNPVVWESKFALRRLEFIGSLCQHFIEWDERGESVFWIEKKRLPSRAGKNQDREGLWYPRFVQTPLSIAPMMSEGVFEPFRTVVCTSATLRIGKSFEYWMNRNGISRIEDDRVLSAAYDSPFHYETNALLAIPDSGPLPDEPGFREFAANAIVSLIQASSGHALVLFTSYDLLRYARDLARKTLAPLGISILSQGDDDRSRLLESFRCDESSVLFATDSFWEGVDAPGDTLLQVIIVKLPFRVPDDPVLEARSQAIEARGGNPFMELSLPDAVVRFRQGFGRLIRRMSDRGVVSVLDRRLVTKRYGKVFLDSLPETRRCHENLATMVASIERFLYT